MIGKIEQLTSNHPYDKMPVSEIGEGLPKHLRDEPRGGSTPSQYGLPSKAIDLQDLIENRDMNFSIGNIFKACYRFGNCSHSDKVRDLRKIIWFANRELNREVENE